MKKKSSPIKVLKNQMTIKEAIEKQLGRDVNDLLNIFFEADETVTNIIYKHKGQRNALLRLIKKFGKEQIAFSIKKAIEVRGETFAPVITDPINLESKLIKLKLYLQKEKNKGGKIIMGTKFDE